MIWKIIYSELDTPFCYDEGDWDGKRSDICAIKDNNNKYYVARMYKGIMDGNKFEDWVEENTGFYIQNVIEFVNLGR